MVDYLNWKDDEGLESKALLSERKEVKLPSALELSKADQTCLGSGMPDYIGYLGKFYAKQMSEVNCKSMKVKYGLARWSTDLETIPFQKLTSEMIRDEYVGELRNFKRSRDLENLTQKKNYVNRKRDPKLIKFAYEVHATPTISLDFVQPSMRAKFIRV